MTDGETVLDDVLAVLNGLDCHLVTLRDILQCGDGKAVHLHQRALGNGVQGNDHVAKGTLVEVDGLSVTALEDIPQGHKMAVKPIKNGENVIKYGFPIGHATADAAPGSWMHTHNVHTNLSGEVEYSYNPAPDLAPLPKVEPETFMGFRRKDGRAAIRNEIWIIPTVGCVNDIAKKIVADNQDLVTGSIEGLYTFTHPFGCSPRWG